MVKSPIGEKCFLDLITSKVPVIMTYFFPINGYSRRVGEIKGICDILTECQKEQYFLLLINGISLCVIYRELGVWGINNKTKRKTTPLSNEILYGGARSNITNSVS